MGPGAPRCWGAEGAQHPLGMQGWEQSPPSPSPLLLNSPARCCVNCQTRGAGNHFAKQITSLISKSFLAVFFFFFFNFLFFLSLSIYKCQLYYCLPLFTRFFSRFTLMPVWPLLPKSPWHATINVYSPKTYCCKELDTFVVKTCNVIVMLNQKGSPAGWKRSFLLVLFQLKTHIKRWLGLKPH